MMGEEKAKTLIESLKPLQLERRHFPCPRCGLDRMDRENPTRNALSRYADVYICDECGTEEALSDMLGIRLPLNEWSLAVSFK